MQQKLHIKYNSLQSWNKAVNLWNDQDENEGHPKRKRQWSEHQLNFYNHSLSSLSLKITILQFKWIVKKKNIYPRGKILSRKKKLQIFSSENKEIISIFFALCVSAFVHLVGFRLKIGK